MDDGRSSRAARRRISGAKRSRVFEPCAQAEALSAFELAAVDWATHGLKRTSPHLSAAGPLYGGQRVVLGLALVVMVIGLAVAPMFGNLMLALAMALPFFALLLLRFAALVVFSRALAEGRAGVRRVVAAIPDDELPTYSVLVPLYREAHVAPGLVAAMRALDYPSDRVEVFFITEADDVPTRQALEACALPANMIVLTVPDGAPRTKPRALNYALRFSHGDLVTIYDAEDQPDAQQLRDAAEAFAAGGAKLGCVQARLAIHNVSASAISRQFAFEYATLFEAILPTLHRLRWPIPLGGTSNHFRRSSLLSVGGWDAYNVTEDADLGFRLSRAGFAVSLIASETLEEAPTTPGAWLGQRTRWLKGWMQTYLVHMRRPRQLYRELGPRGFWGVQFLLGGMVGSALVHPWVYVTLAYAAMTRPSLLPTFDAPLEVLLWTICGANLVLGYAFAAMLSALAARRRFPGVARFVTITLLPVYWLAISIAAYRALVELVRRPYYWHKTEHQPRPDCTAPISV